MTDDPFGRLRARCFGPPGVIERLIDGASASFVQASTSSSAAPIT
jgi:hypothetical protein